MLVKVFCGIGECGEDQYLPVPGVDRIVDFSGDQLFQRSEFFIVLRRDLFRNMEQFHQMVLVGLQFLFPAYDIAVLNQHLDLIADQQIRKDIRIDFNVVNVQFIEVYQIA